jgi:hypothetical protein
MDDRIDHWLIFMGLWNKSETVWRYISSKHKYTMKKKPSKYEEGNIGMVDLKKLIDLWRKTLNV